MKKFNSHPDHPSYFYAWIFMISALFIGLSMPPDDESFDKVTILILIMGLITILGIIYTAKTTTYVYFSDHAIGEKYLKIKWENVFFTVNMLDPKVNLMRSPSAFLYIDDHFLSPEECAGKDKLFVYLTPKRCQALLQNYKKKVHILNFKDSNVVNHKIHNILLNHNSNFE